MKIAVLGDIHGNIDALKVAYEAAVSSKAEKIYHLGDLGGYAPFINEVVDFIIEHKIDGVRGNYDEAVAYDNEHCGCRAEDPLQEKMAALGFKWTKRRATDRTRGYLKTLPFEISFSCNGYRVKLYHAAPINNKLYWHEDRSDYFFQGMARVATADVIIYGHTHIPYRKDLDGKTFINAGSVGKPKDGDTRTCVTLVDITRGAVVTEFLRVPYDVENVASAVMESGLPTYFADKLRTGR
jgi:putative phosphoesterase